MNPSAMADRAIPLTASIDESPLAEQLARWHVLADVEREPISPAEGRFLYALARALKPRNAVNLESAFSPRLLYLGAALRDNWGGRVIGSEPSPLRYRRAISELTAAGLSPYVELRPGSAREAFAVAPPLGIDLLVVPFRDEAIGDLLESLRPHLEPGAVVLGPGGGGARGRGSALPWETQPFPSGLEFAVVD